MSLTRLHPFYRNLPYSARVPDEIWYTGGSMMAFYQGFLDTSSEQCCSYQPLYILLNASCCDNAARSSILEVLLFGKQGKRISVMAPPVVWELANDGIILNSDLCIEGNDLEISDDLSLSDYQERLLTAFECPNTSNLEGFSLQQTLFWDLDPEFVCPEPLCKEPEGGCPEGSTWDPDECECKPEAKDCPSGFTLNTETGKCEKDPPEATGEIKIQNYLKLTTFDQYFTVTNGEIDYGEISSTVYEEVTKLNTVTPSSDLAKMIEVPFYTRSSESGDLLKLYYPEKAVIRKTHPLIGYIPLAEVVSNEYTLKFDNNSSVYDRVAQYFRVCYAKEADTYYYQRRWFCVENGYRIQGSTNDRTVVLSNKCYGLDGLPGIQEEEPECRTKICIKIVATIGLNVNLTRKLTKYDPILDDDIVIGTENYFSGRLTADLEFELACIELSGNLEDINYGLKFLNDYASNLINKGLDTLLYQLGPIGEIATQFIDFGVEIEAEAEDCGED